MDVNAKSVFLCYKYAAEQMIKQGVGGRIIGASSVAGKRGTWTRLPSSLGDIVAHVCNRHMRVPDLLRVEIRSSRLDSGCWCVNH